MLKRTKANLPQLQVGDNVRVGVPKIDRAGLDSPNIIGVVTEVTEHGNYRVGTEHGLLKGSLSQLSGQMQAEHLPSSRRCSNYFSTKYQTNSNTKFEVSWSGNIPLQLQNGLHNWSLQMLKIPAGFVIVVVTLV